MPNPKQKISKQKHQTIVPICLKCGSTNLKSSVLINPAEYALLSIKAKTPVNVVPKNSFTFICKDCDYVGICPEIDEKQVAGFRRKLKRKNI